MIKMVNMTELVLATVALIRTLWPPQPQVFDGCSYDFVIIGSGAGAVLANRLSERSDFSVLLIEAGDIPLDDASIPAAFTSTTNSPMDWNFTSISDRTTINQENNHFRISSGKVLGGTSNINHFLFIRDVPENFDNLAEYLDSPSWKYKNMLHYFKKSENYKDAAIMNSDYRIFHGNAGPVNITRQISNITIEYIKAFAELGYPVNRDLNSDTLTGYGVIPYIIDVVRQSLANTYILAARDRPNLHILRKTYVTKVIIEDNVAKGVEADLENGDKIKIFAKKEVLVCGGVIESPKLLMMSGIGPQKLLKKFGIPVIANLPVGYNLQEHVSVPIIHKMDYSTAPTTSSSLDQLFPTFMGSVIMDEDTTIPQYQTTNLYFEHDNSLLMVALSTIFNIKTELSEMIVKESEGRNTLFSIVTIYNPESRGSVTIQSADPYDYPIIDLNFYGNETDLTNMVRYMEDFLRITNSTLFRELGAEVFYPEFPDCSRSYLECYALSLSVNLFHPACTCPMGTVLDSNAKVLGVDRLRVVDASMFPRITTGNPLATIIAAAEKISDVIKDIYPTCSK